VQERSKNDCRSLGCLARIVGRRDAHRSLRPKQDVEHQKIRSDGECKHSGTAYSSPRVLELVLQGKRNGHRDFCPSAGIHENDIAFNRFGFLVCRSRDVVE
jgi:hypothetical protein